MFTLEELARRLGCEFRGEATRQLAGLGTLSGAGSNQLSFLSNRKYLRQLDETGAGAVILHPEHAPSCPVDCLLSETPYLTFARATALFDTAPQVAAGVHAHATVSPDAEVHTSASVAAGAVIDAGAVVGEGAVIGARCYVGHDSYVGPRSRLYPGVVLYHDVRIGADCIVHANAVIGADGFGFAPSDHGWEKLHQTGGVRIGDRVEIGACTTIDRGAIEHTVLEDGVIVDNQVQIAHNCRIGKNTAIAGCTGLAGSTIIGRNCTLAGAVGVVGHLEICDNVHVTAMTLVTRSITQPGSYSSGTPMLESRQWRRNAVRFGHLDAIQKRLAALEKPTQS